MLGFLLVAFVLMTTAVSAVIGEGRFYLQRTEDGCRIRQHYGAWLRKAFASLSAVGFSLLVMMPLAEIFAALTKDFTEKPYIFSIYPAVILGIGYFQFILRVARRCENNYRRRRSQRLRSIEKIADAESLENTAVTDATTEIDVIDPTVPAEMKRAERSTRLQRPQVESSRHQGWGVVQGVKPCAVIGSLALEGEKEGEINAAKPLAEEIEPQAKNVALPIVNLKAEQQLELQLAALPEADRALVEQLFVEEPVVRRWALQPGCMLRLGIVPETEHAPRHIRICGIIFPKRKM